MAVTVAGATPADVDTSDRPTDDPRTARPRRASWWWDVPLLLLAPPVFFFVLRVRPMTDLGLVDSWIYTGYQLNGSDLIRRFGPDAYHWVRLGALVPERASSWLFGPLPGFYVLRYALALLAVVPLFVLLRDRIGRAGAWAGVAAVLASPVAWNTWGTDYPDALIFSYLVAGVSLLALPVRRGWPRALTVAAAGVVLSLAVHSQVVVAPLVAVVVVVHLVVAGRGRRSALLTFGGLVAVGLGVTAALMAVAHVWFGQWDIFSPTVDNFRTLQQPDKVVLWHSVDDGWVRWIPSTAVPFLVVGAWVVLAVRDRRSVTRAELAIGATATLGAAVWAALQFLGTVAALEYRLYVSALWALCLPALGLVAARLAGAPRSRWAWWAPVVLLAASLATSFRQVPATFAEPRWVLGAAAAVVLAVLVAGLLGRVRVVGVVAATVVVALLVGVTVLPARKPKDPARFTQIAQPQYGVVFGDLTELTFLRSYGLAAQLPDLIGHGAAGARTLFWTSTGVPGQTPSDLPATYRWKFTKTGLPTPENRDALVASAYAYRPDPLVMVTMTDAQAAEYVDTWAQAGHPLTVSGKAVISSFGLTVHVWLARPTDQIGTGP